MTKLFFLGYRSTGHAGQLFVHAEVVLECYAGQRLALFFNLYAFLGLYGLVETGAVAPPVHQAARKLVHNDDLAVLFDVVAV